MARRGGSFGMLLLVIVAACVLLLVARAWRDLAPAAIDVSTPTRAVDDHGQSEAGEAVRSGDLPGLDDLRKESADHARDVQDALAATE